MLSLCMIVRDEAHNLRQHLPRMKGVAEEIIVVDTGSRDDSQRVAGEMGARVLVADWRDDFSEARNLALSQASQPWILVLDADETMSDCHLPLLRMLVGAPPVNAYRFPTRNYVRGSEGVPKWNPCKRVFPEEHNQSGWYPSLKVRVFPNLPRVRFHYRIHERIEPSLRRAGIPVHAAALLVHHFGTLGEPGRQARRNVYFESLLRRKLEEHPGCTTSMWEYARQLAQNGKFQEATELYAELVGRAPHHVEAREELAYLLYRRGRCREAAAQAELALNYRRHSSISWCILALCLAEARENFQYALALDPLYHPSLLRLGRMAIDDGDAERAFEYLNRAVQVRPACADTQALLGAAFLSRDRLSEARQHLSRAESLSPNCPTILSHLALVHMKERDPQGARSLLSRALAVDPDHPAALDCWRKLGEAVNP